VCRLLPLTDVHAWLIGDSAHELALRLAVGADYGRLVRLVLGEGAALVIVGMNVFTTAIARGTCARALR
jgi:hypothetical protein